MNLAKLFETQKKLDDRIVKEKGLECQDLLPLKILALLTELGELANEWRGFKFWSNNQEPRYERVCHACRGQKHFILTSEGHKEVCTYCEGTGIEAKPLLEEYVDCLHFILSIGNDLDQKPLFNFQLDKNTTVVDSFLNVMELAIELDANETAVFDYDILFMRFYELGVIQLGFTWDQIEQAYFEKNKINHARQDGGY